MKASYEAPRDNERSKAHGWRDLAEATLIEDKPHGQALACWQKDTRMHRAAELVNGQGMEGFAVQEKLDHGQVVLLHGNSDCIVVFYLDFAH